jgi:hypothetical protein
MFSHTLIRVGMKGTVIPTMTHTRQSLASHHGFPSNNFILYAHLCECDDSSATVFQVASADDMIESSRRDYDVIGFARGATRCN